MAHENNGDRLTPVRYLASTYVDARAITASGSMIASVLQSLKDDRFLPTAVQEQGPSGIVTRMAFSTQDESITLMLQGARFDYAWSSPESGVNGNDSFSDFCADALVKLQILIRQFKLTPHRLAAVQELVLREDDDLPEEKIIRRLMNLPAPYADQLPFEWSWRANSAVTRKVGSLREITNTITTVQHAITRHVRIGPGGIEQRDEQQVHVGFDINTSQENQRVRFKPEHVRSFFNQVPTWQDELSTGVLSFILKGGE